MKTLILPGYSISNKPWAYEVKERLDKNLNVQVHEWKHWRDGSSSIVSKTNHKLSLQMAKGMDVNYEVGVILSELGTLNKDETINIVAKSIGTKVAMVLVSIIKDNVGKVILCGVPIDPLGYLKGIKIVGKEKLLVIQNSRDPLMPFSLISKYFKLLDKDIKVLEKKSDTHDYPYYEEFERFLLI